MGVLTVLAVIHGVALMAVLASASRDVQLVDEEEKPLARAGRWQMQVVPVTDRRPIVR